MQGDGKAEDNSALPPAVGFRCDTIYGALTIRFSITKPSDATIYSAIVLGAATVCRIWSENCPECEKRKKVDESIVNWVIEQRDLS